MAVRKVEHLSLEERQARGKEARHETPVSAHDGWEPAVDRPDPVKLLEDQNTTREPDLVPVRHGRMMVSPFTFYRGSAKIMASDLAGTPTAGLDVQLCGDAHLSNFGLFASPERTLLFDVNDFDETLPGPFEYDVKRLAASFTIAARNNGFPKPAAREVTMTCVAAYREAMAGFAAMRMMDIWYARLDEDELQTAMRRAARQVAKDNAARHAGKGKKAAKDAKGARDAKEASKLEKRGMKTAQKAHTRDSLQALAKLGEIVDGRYRIVSMPPVVVPFRELHEMYGITPGQLQQILTDQFREYRATLQPDRRQLLERFEIVDMARKVVGVGSVGTRAFIALLQGQRLMQASSDIFLGWSKGYEANRYFYWRQLRDMKGSAEVEMMPPEGLAFYARICGWTLARAHARSGDAAAIAAYLGTSDRFDKSITDFSQRYADQNEQDYQAFTDAVHTGRITAVEGI